MQKLQILPLIAALTFILLTGCDRNDENPLVDPAKEISNLQASDQFTWSTAKPVRLKITGLPTVIPVTNTLTISLSNGTKVFNRFHRMDTDLTLDLLVPSEFQELLLGYGSTRQTIQITDNQAQFSFIPVVTD